MAFDQQRILITSDKHFGEMVYRARRPHWGVILLRLHDERTESKIGVLSRFFAQYADKAENALVVVSTRGVRFAKPHYESGGRGQEVGHLLSAFRFLSPW